MNNRTFRTMLATALVVCAMMLTAGVNRASAQQQNLNCCTFTIVISPTVPFGCFPLTFITDWCPTGQFTYTAPGPGTFTIAVPGVCPFAPYFLSVAVPSGPVVMLNNSGTVVLPCGSTHTYTATLDAAGCVLIQMF